MAGTVGSVSKRLESLDVLRGFDLFLLVALCPVLLKLREPLSAGWFQATLTQFTHKSWEGFALWDLVMPLFMFMSGVTIPFAFSRYRSPGVPRRALYLRIFKRFLLLWVLGMISQGNLLALNIAVLKPLSNTLQAIAVGYLFASVIYLNCRPWVRYAWAVALLLIYWALMMFIRVDGYGGGDFSPAGNLAEWVDRTWLGGWRDGAQWAEDGSVVFGRGYFYTWILSSLTFVATVLSGAFAGDYLKNSGARPERKALILFVAGAVMVACGWLWHVQMPVIKTIWTSSMVLVSGGYCYLLLALFYWWIDCRGHRRGLEWLKVFGMNSIVAYMLESVVNFRCIGRSLFFGLEPYVGSFYPFIIELSNVAVLYLILYGLYKRNWFIRV